MKRILTYIYTIVLMILLSYQMFATNWYVDKNATGSNNGTSWTNAWESLAEINWASVNGGDFIYISGGSSSKTYAETLDPGSWQGTATSRLTIIAGKYAPSPSGHNGTVILNGIHFGGASLGSGNMPSYITVKGFTVTVNNVFLEGDYQWVKGIMIDSCYIHDYGSDFGVKIIKYVDSTIISNNIIIDCLAGDCAGDRDGIHVNEDAGGIPGLTIIRGNYVRVTSQDPNAHNDAFQAVSGDGFYVYNNVFINDSVNSPEGGGMPAILSAVDAGNNDTPPVLVFNNFMFMNGIWDEGANQGWVYELRHDAGTTWAEILPTYIFGNTMVSNGPRNRVFGNGEAYLNLALNNIWASFCPPDGATDWRTDGVNHGWMEVFGVGAVYTTHLCIIDSVRANLFWRQDSTDGPAVDGQQSMIIGDFNTGSLDYSSDWADWISIGGSGLFRDPLLTTPFGHLSNQGLAVPDIESNSPAIDAGEDYSYLPNYLHTTYPAIPQDVLDAMLVDFYGNERGADGDWDIGAVEYTTGGWTPPDTTATVTLNSVTNAELNSYHIGSGVLSGADSTFHIWTTTADSFRVTGGTLNTTMVTAVSGNTLYIPVIASSQYSTSVTDYVVVSGTTRSFTVTTKADPYVPPSGTGKIMKGSNGKVLRDSTGKIIKTK